MKLDLPGLQIFGQANDASSSAAAPRVLRDLGQRLQRTYCSAARGAVEVLQAPEEGTPVQDGGDGHGMGIQWGIGVSQSDSTIQPPDPLFFVPINE